MSELLTPPIEWTTVKARVKDLIPFEYNPRVLTEDRKELLKKSLEKFNLAEIPAINTDNKIIAGHQRVKVLLELGRGDELIDVRIPNRRLTDKEFKEYNITSNVPTGFWDADILEEFFADINLDELGLNIDDIEIPEILIPEELKEEDEQPFEPEPPIDPVSKEGDIYVLRSLQKNIEHRVVCGDSTESSVLRNMLNSDKIQLTVTDPPYNVDYKGGAGNKREGIKNDKQTDANFYEFLLSFYKSVFAFSVPGAPIYVFHADTEGVNFRKAFKDAGFKLSQCLIWKKQSMVLSRQDYHWKHEPCLYGWKEGWPHPWYSDRTQTTILEFDRPTRSDDHPTMKPLDLISYLIANSSRQKNIVFDGFLGSGTSLIACELLWRHLRGIELDPRYVDVNIERWVKYMKDNNRKFEVLKNGIKLTNTELDAFSKQINS